VRKFLLRSVKWGVFGGYSVSSHAQPTIFSSSTILFQPNFAGLLKLPLISNVNHIKQKVKPGDFSEQPFSSLISDY
ncbi:MAG: hypothetical protein IJW23_05760, partial [Lentisphaeria bacterium]|nr:hypothetical protein [Lentisphaeria bacterium]